MDEELDLQRCNAIFDEVYKEREYQAKRWADDDVTLLVERDLERTPHPDTWTMWICRYLGGWNTRYAFPADYGTGDLILFRAAMLKVAALALAAIIWVDEKLTRE